MKKLIYISFIFVFLLAFASCEKMDYKPIDRDDPFLNFDCDGQDCGTKGPGDGTFDDDNGQGEGDEDEDGDGDGDIVDPDEDDDDLDDDNGK